MKKLRRFRLFASTLLSSAWNEFTITGRVKWRTAPAILRALWQRQAVDRRPGSPWWRRMRGCQRCPLYDRRRRACGILGQTFPWGGEQIPLGCGCVIFKKADLPEARCWLQEMTAGASGVDWQAPGFALASDVVAAQDAGNVGPGSNAYD